MKLHKSTTAGVYFSARQSHDADFRVSRNIQDTSRKYVVAKRRPELCRGVVLYFHWDVVLYTDTLKEAAEIIDNYYDPHGRKRALAPTQKGGAA
jgi:hypothetical protein